MSFTNVLEDARPYFQGLPTAPHGPGPMYSGGDGNQDPSPSPPDTAPSPRKPSPETDTQAQLPDCIKSQPDEKPDEIHETKVERCEEITRHNENKEIVCVQEQLTASSNRSDEDKKPLETVDKSCNLELQTKVQNVESDEQFEKTELSNKDNSNFIKPDDTRQDIFEKEETAPSVKEAMETCESKPELTNNVINVENETEKMSSVTNKFHSHEPQLTETRSESGIYQEQQYLERKLQSVVNSQLIVDNTKYNVNDKLGKELPSFQTPSQNNSGDIMQKNLQNNSHYYLYNTQYKDQSVMQNTKAHSVNTYPTNYETQQTPKNEHRQQYSDNIRSDDKKQLYESYPQNYNHLMYSNSTELPRKQLEYESVSRTHGPIVPNNCDRLTLNNQHTLAIKQHAYDAQMYKSQYLSYDDQMKSVQIPQALQDTRKDLQEYQHANSRVLYPQTLSQTHQNSTTKPDAHVPMHNIHHSAEQVNIHNQISDSRSRSYNNPSIDTRQNSQSYQIVHSDERLSADYRCHNPLTTNHSQMHKKQLIDDRSLCHTENQQKLHNNVYLRSDSRPQSNNGLTSADKVQSDSRPQSHNSQIIQVDSRPHSQSSHITIPESRPQSHNSQSMSVDRPQSNSSQHLYPDNRPKSHSSQNIPTDRSHSESNQILSLETRPQSQNNMHLCSDSRPKSHNNQMVIDRALPYNNQMITGSQPQSNNNQIARPHSNNSQMLLSDNSLHSNRVNQPERLDKTMIRTGTHMADRLHIHNHALENRVQTHNNQTVVADNRLQNHDGRGRVHTYDKRSYYNQQMSYENPSEVHASQQSDRRLSYDEILNTNNQLQSSNVRSQAPDARSQYLQPEKQLQVYSTRMPEQSAEHLFNSRLHSQNNNQILRDGHLPVHDRSHEMSSYKISHNEDKKSIPPIHSEYQDVMHVHQQNNDSYTKTQAYLHSQENKIQNDNRSNKYVPGIHDNFHSLDRHPESREQKHVGYYARHGSLERLPVNREQVPHCYTNDSQNPKSQTVYLEARSQPYKIKTETMTSHLPQGVNKPQSYETSYKHTNNVTTSQNGPHTTDKRVLEQGKALEVYPQITKFQELHTNKSREYQYNLNRPITTVSSDSKLNAWVHHTKEGRLNETYLRQDLTPHIKEKISTSFGNTRAAHEFRVPMQTVQLSEKVSSNHYSTPKSISNTPQSPHGSQYIHQVNNRNYSNLPQATKPITIPTSNVPQQHQVQAYYLSSQKQDPCCQKIVSDQYSRYPTATIPNVSSYESQLKHPSLPKSSDSLKYANAEYYQHSKHSSVYLHPKQYSSSQQRSVNVPTGLHTNVNSQYPVQSEAVTKTTVSSKDMRFHPYAISELEKANQTNRNVYVYPPTVNPSTNSYVDKVSKDVRLTNHQRKPEITQQNNTTLNVSQYSRQAQNYTSTSYTLPTAHHVTAKPALQEALIKRQMSAKQANKPSATENQYRSWNVWPAKRESPLDLSVKTVRTSADSTADDDVHILEHMNIKNPSHQRVHNLVSAPRVDFLPNFSINQQSTRPSNHAIRPTFEPQSAAVDLEIPRIDLTEESDKTKRSSETYTVPNKVPQVENWRLQIDRQIEQKLLLEKQRRTAANNQPPNGYISSINQNISPKTAGLAEKYWAHRTQAEATQTLGRSASYSRLHQVASLSPTNTTGPGANKRVLSLLRNSIEIKEAQRRIEQEQIKPIDNTSALSLKPVKSEPSPGAVQKFHIPRAIDSICLDDTSPTVLNANVDLDGLAANLAARIRTKAELKQLHTAQTSKSHSQDEVQSSTEDFKKTELGASSPPKLTREQCANLPRRRVFSKTEDDVNPVHPPRNSVLRSSSEASVFDFRDSDSETEMPVLERLDDLRRDRKSVTKTINETTEFEPIVKLELQETPDPIWSDTCDKFLEELRTGGTKKRGRKKKIPEIDIKPQLNIEIKTEICDEEYQQIEIKQEQEDTVINETLIEEKEPVLLIPKIEPDSDSDVPLIRKKNNGAQNKLILDSDYSSDEDIIRVHKKSERSGAKIKLESTSESSSDNEDVKKETNSLVIKRHRGRPPRNSTKGKIISKESFSAKSQPKTEENTTKKKPWYGDGSDFRPGWEEEAYRYKRSLRMPAQLINIPRPTRLSTSLPDLDPCPSPVTTSLTDMELSRQKSIQRTSHRKRLDSDGDSNSSHNIRNFEDIEDTSLSLPAKRKSGENSNSIIDVLAQRYSQNKRRKYKNKIENTGPKTIPKAINLLELLPTPSLGIGVDKSVKKSKNKKENVPKVETSNALLGFFRKETVNTFRNAFLSTSGLETFKPIILTSRTRKETRVLKQQATIREVFGEDRPASAPPMTHVQEPVTKESKEPTKVEEKPKSKAKSRDARVFSGRAGLRSSIVLRGHRSIIKTKRQLLKKRSMLKNKVKIGIKPSVKHEGLKQENIKQDIKQEIKQEPNVGENDSVKTEESTDVPKKRIKIKGMRRKFSSGFDYIRKKKKYVKKEPGTDNNNKGIKRRSGVARPNAESVQDIQREIKGWVLNKGIGETHLHRAARLGYTDVTAYCLETLQNPPSPKDNAGYTPLHEACSRGHLDIVRLLLLYGANVHESAQGGIRPLHEAAENGFVQIIRLLLAYGADPLLATYSGYTPLSLATDSKSITLMEQHLADVQGRGSSLWKFSGPAYCFDTENKAYDVLEHAPSPSPEPQEEDIEVELSDVALPNLYSLRGEPSNDRWILFQDICSLLKVKTKDALLRQIGPSSVSTPSTVIKELKMTDFLEQACCCQLLSAGEKINIRASKISLVKYTERVKQLLGVEKIIIPAR